MISAAPRSSCSVLAFTVVALAALTACADQPTALESRTQLRPQFALGNVLTVTTLDGGADVGSLRAVINQTTGGETIHFDPSLAGKTIVVDSTLTVPNFVTIEGPQDKGITISGGGNFRVFNMKQGGILKNLAVTGGQFSFASGVLSGGPVTIDHVSIYGNKAGNAPAIQADKALITIINSTIANNEALARGIGAGGGIDYDFTAGLTLVNSTVAHNIPNGITGHGSNQIGTILLRNSIVATNGTLDASGFITPKNCEFKIPFAYEGRNIADDESCGDATKMVIADPLLEPNVADNGGPTLTVALTTNSPAIDGGANCTETTDQRFIPRDAKCDIGAFELVFTKIALTIGSTGQLDSNTGTVTLTGTATCSRTESFDIAVTLQQGQKLKGLPTLVSATRTIPIVCQTTPHPWIASIAPPVGQVFLNGGASVTAASANTARGVNPATTTSDVQLHAVKK